MENKYSLPSTGPVWGQRKNVGCTQSKKKETLAEKNERIIAYSVMAHCLIFFRPTLETVIRAIQMYGTTLNNIPSCESTSSRRMEF